MKTIGQWYVQLGILINTVEGRTLLRNKPKSQVSPVMEKLDSLQVEYKLYLNGKLMKHKKKMGSRINIGVYD